MVLRSFKFTVSGKPLHFTFQVAKRHTLRADAYWVQTTFYSVGLVANCAFATYLKWHACSF